MKSDFRRLLLLSISSLAVTGGHAAFAADAAPLTTVDEVIVVGTAGGKGVSRMDAAFAVTNISSTELATAAPKSSAEILTLVPGVWVESSGGVAGANIMVRGLPSGGDAPFVSFQLQGMPVYPAASLSFLENSSMFRADETISRVEALRGGPSSVFSNGQPGLTANFVLKEGAEQTVGLVKTTFTDYGTRRVDALMSGKLADDLYYMIGGYATTSPGIRDTQFDSEVGQQLTLNITKKFEGGKVTAYTRATDDHGAWYLPFATNVPGIDLGTYTQLGNFSRFVTLQVDAGGATQTFDLAHGRGWKGTVSGVDFEKSFDNGWSVRNRFGYTEGNADTYGLVPDGGAIRATALTSGAAPAFVGPVKTADGRTLGGNDFVQNWGSWIVQKRIKALTDEFSVSKTLATHDLTAGYYTTSYSSDDFWSLGNIRPMQVVANGNFLASNISCSTLAAAGTGSSCFVFGVRDAGDARVDAFYLADSWAITDAFRLDLGVRNEQDKTKFILHTNSPGVSFPNAIVAQVVDDTRTHVSYTAGLNYRIDDKMGVFGRYSKGYLNPNFDDFRNGQPDSSVIEQYEAGYKLSTGHVSFFATAYHNTFTGAKNFNLTTGVAEQDSNEATGVEFDGAASTDFGLSATVNGTFQKTKINESTDRLAVGKKTLRQPDYQVRFTPSYAFDIAGYAASVYGTVAAIGKRFSDNENTVLLPSYTKVDLGGTLKIGNVDLQLAADNVGDSHGFTEGDPRSVGSNNARPIFGRSLRFSAAYNF
jgi:outer membrane receptor protein involved in Fe transport